MIVWLVEAIKNLYLCIVLNLFIPILCFLLWRFIFNIRAIYHQKSIPIHSLSFTIDILVCGSICGSSSPWISPLITFFFPIFLWLPLFSLDFEHLFDDVFDYYQMCFSGRQTFSSRNLVPLWKVLRVWFICWNLALLGVCYLILSSLFYFLEWDKSLRICVLISSFMLNSFCSVHLLNFVEQILCWFDSLI